MVVATTDQIADALSGRHGLRVVRARARTTSRTLVDSTDMSAAIEGGTVELDNSRAIYRTCTLRVHPELLPFNFDIREQYVRIFYDVYVAATSEWVAFPLGYFKMDFPRKLRSDNGREVWEMKGADLSTLLVDQKSYGWETASASNYITELDSVASVVGLGTAFTAFATTTIVPFSWERDSTYFDIMNDLVSGINYYRPWMSVDGLLASTPKPPAYNIPIGVTYSTRAEPRMLLRSGPINDQVQVTGLPNQAQVTFSSPRAVPITAAAMNGDSTSDISTALRGYNNLVAVKNPFVPSFTVAFDVASQMIWDAVAQSRQITITTLPDPRRDANEFYTIAVENHIDVSNWRVFGWSLPLPPSDAPMVHRLGYAPDTVISVGL